MGKNDFPRWNKLVSEVLANKEKQAKENMKEDKKGKTNRKAEGKR